MPGLYIESRTRGTHSGSYLGNRTWPGASIKRHLTTDWVTQVRIEFPQGGNIVYQKSLGL
jgi:spore maturation protein CgeB